MEFTGLLTPYPVDRPLTDEERSRQLRQKQRLDIKISHELTVIEINSNWMEVVDKYFFDKGMLATAGVFGISFNFALLMFFLFAAIFDLLKGNWDALIIFPLFPLGVGISWLIWKGFRNEINYTHYPIRFNRQTRKVHVFRQDGTVLTVDWDKVFFTQMRVTGGAWDIVGHVLDKDSVTVRETFALPSTTFAAVGRDTSRGYWEFIRRYMEDGPGSVFANITGCLPIKHAREAFTFRYHFLAFSYGPIHPIIPLYYLFYPGRWLAMRFSKIPQWPEEIEAQCPVEPNDPYFRDASMNPV